MGNSRSPIFAAALDVWAECRAEFELYRQAAYQRAENDTNGRMLNRRGRLEKVNPYSLFIGPQPRAEAFASEELIEHWRRYPRPVFARYESQWKTPE